MTIREQLEQREHEILAPWASFSDQTKGRARDEEPCDIRPVYQRDRDRILHSKPFRRLKDKTQVFLTPDGDHYRTRMTHTLEVSQNARTIAKALMLNEDLTEAIALGHDLGHTPFGHAGERALDRVCREGFRHNEQSLRIVDHLARGGRGINLTWEVRDGILNHQTRCMPSTLEGQIVRLSDKIAYIHHDMDDAIRAGVLTDADVPSEIGDVLGRTLGERLDTLIHAIISESMGKPVVAMAPPVWEAMQKMRAFMNREVYTNRRVKGEESKAEALVETLFHYYMDHISELPDTLLAKEEAGDSRERIVCDYISSMTDRFAISRYEELYIPRNWSIY